MIYEQNRERIPAWARVFLTILTILLAIVCAREVFAEEGAAQETTPAAQYAACLPQVWDSAQKLQPWWHRARNPIVQSRRAKKLQDFTDAVCAEALPRNIMPRLMVALAFREASIMPHVGLGPTNGDLDERGYWQVMPGGKAEQFVPTTCSQHVPSCNARSATSYLAWLRDDHCKSTDLWVVTGAYGRGHCPNSPTEARTWDEVKIARRIYCSIEPNCNETWPE